MSSANKPFEVREARICGARASAYVYVAPGQPAPAAGAHFRLTGHGLERGQGGTDLWTLLSIVRAPGTGFWFAELATSL